MKNALDAFDTTGKSAEYINFLASHRAVMGNIIASNKKNNGKWSVDDFFVYKNSLMRGATLLTTALDWTHDEYTDMVESQMHMLKIYAPGL